MKVARALLTLAVCLLAASASAQDVDEKDVIVLTDSNFEETVGKYEKILVEFYAPWCGHCKQLTPHYAEAATKLKATFPEVGIAKIDADSQKESGNKYGVQGFPTLKWFVNGKATDYTGGRTADTIVSWVSKRMGPPTKTLAAAKDFDEFKESKDVVVVGFFDKPEGDAFKEFEAVATELEDVELGSAHDKAVHKHAGHKHGEIVLFKKFDEGKAVFKGKATAAEIKEFVLTNQLRYVNEFSPETSGKIFGSPINRQVLLFADKAKEGFDKVRERFEAQAKQHYGKVVGVHVNADTKQVLEFFGVKEGDMPCVYAVKVPPKEEGGGGMVKYQGPGSDKLGDDKAIKTFFSDFIADKVEAHKKSEEAPEKPEDEHGVTTLVGKTFEETVLKSDKDVFVEFYAPWCGHCKQLAPIWDKLGEQFKTVESVVIAKMDATANDPPEGLNIQGFPTLKFFKSGSDKSKPMDYDGDRTVKGFRKFLKANAGQPFELPKKEKKKKPASAEL
jgi:protein disulfide-isomerase A1